jgi:TusA-related sulfurtransferase
MCLIEDLRQGEALQVITDLEQIEEDFEQKSDDSDSMLELLPVSSSSDSDSKADSEPDALP